MALSGEQQRELEEQLQQAVIACNERCLYFAAKWSAELLNSFASQEDTVPDDDASDTDVDEPEDQASSTKPRHPDSKEKRLEAKELPRYLMAKSFFDCREYDRCASVFLSTPIPHSTPAPDLTSPSKLFPSTASPARPGPSQRTSARFSSGTPKTFARTLPRKISQRSLFLALYARYLSGEKRKNEDSETILGPNDGAGIPNKEAPGILAIL
ncbi:hypothetical protein KC343_g20620, partial [Hortaea werneckii]